MDVVDQVRTLQEVDAEILRIERALREDYPKAERKSRLAVEEIKGTLESRRDEIRRLRMKSDQLMLKLKAEEDKAREREVQLNTAKSNKEYEAIQMDIASIRADSSLVEDEVYRLMEHIEQCEAQLPAVQKQLGDAEAEMRETLDEIEEYREKEEARLGELRESRAQAVRLFKDENALRLYERIRDAREGHALVAVSGDTCQGCYMRVSPNTIAQVHAKKFPVLCSSCGRLLYLEEVR